MFRKIPVIEYSNKEYNSDMNCIFESVDNYIETYYSNKEKLEDVVFMSESTNEDIALFESENKNIVTKLGEAIIKFFETIKKKFDEIVNKFKSALKKKEEVPDASLKQAMENHPELAKSFYDGIRNGNIRINDFKDIDALLNTAEKLQKDLVSGKIDEKSFSDKVDGLLNSVEKKVVPIGNIAKAVTTVATCITGLMMLTRKYRDDNYKMEASRKNYTAKSEAAMEQMRAKAESDNGKYTYLRTMMKKNKEIHDYVYGQESRIVNLLDKLAEFSSKLAPDKYKRTEKENIKIMTDKNKFIKDTPPANNNSGDTGSDNNSSK